MSLSVSIITPSFNSYTYIKENIDSVLSLGESVKEHVIFDGGSDDGTVSFLKDCQSEKLYWVSKPDKGQTDAINKAIEKSTGDIIGWLNSDDAYVDDILDEVIKLFEKRPDIDIIHGDVFIIGQNGETIGISRGKKINKVDDLLCDNPIKQPGLFFRRKIIHEIGLLNEGLHYVMDREYWFRALNNKVSFYYTGKPLAKFRLISGTKTFENNEKFRLEWIEVLKRNRGRFQIENSILNKAIRENKGFYHFSLGQKKIGRKFSFLRENFIAFILSKKLRYNLGFYKLILLGFLGIKRDRYMKWRK